MRKMKRAFDVAMVENVRVTVRLLLEEESKSNSKTVLYVGVSEAKTPAAHLR